MSGNIYRPRLSIDISEEHLKKLGEIIPWGTRSRLLSIVIEDLIDIIAIHGEMAIGAILSRNISALDILKMAQEGKRERG